MASQLRYKAFFSYSRADDKHATKLHRRLDRFRSPKYFIPSLGTQSTTRKSLHPIFKDRTDLAVGGALTTKIVEALAQSAALIVFCSPAASRSQWVDIEVSSFIALSPDASVFPVIGPDCGDVDNVEEAFFPPSLRGKGLLGADLREIRRSDGRVVGDGLEGGTLKLIAGLLGVPLDALVQRERKRQRSVIAALTGASVTFLALAVAAVGLGFIANVNAREADNQRQRAEQNERDARTTLHRMFAERAWLRLKENDVSQAAMYALAGLQISEPSQQHEFEAALGAALQLFGEADAVLLHRGPLDAAAFSNDGRYIATASDDATAAIWTGDGKRQAHLLAGHSDGLWSAEFSPNDRKLVTGSADGTARIWDVETGKMLVALSPGDGEIRIAHFDQSGDSILTAGLSGVLRVWSSDGHLVSTCAGQAGAIRAASFSANGKLVAMLTEKGVLQICDRTKGTREFSTQAHDGEGISLAFLPNGRIVTAGSDGVANIWSASGALQMQLSGHSDAITSIAVSPNGAMLATASRDRTVRLWSTRSGALISTLSGHGDWVNDVRFSHHGGHVLSVSSDRTLRVWEVSTGHIEQIVRGHRDVISSGAWSRDDDLILTASQDGSARLYSAEVDARQERVLDFKDKKWTTLSSDGDYSAVIRTNGAVEVFDADTASDVPIVIPAGWGIESIGFKAGSVIGLGSEGHLHRWTYVNGRFEPDPDDKDVQKNSTAANSSRLEEVSLVYGGTPVTYPSAYRSPSDHDTSVVVDTEGRASIHSASRPDDVRQLDHRGRVIRARFSPDGRRILTVGEDRTGKIWDVNTSALQVTLSGHLWHVTEGIFSTDGRRVVTAAQDGTARVWDLATGALMFTTPASKTSVDHIALIDGDTVLRTIDAGGILHDWPVGRLTGSREAMIQFACQQLQGPGSRFTRSEIDADPLLGSEWSSADRSVCTP